MIPISNYNEIESAADFTRLPAGGYVLKITSATDNAEKQYFELVYDIAEGDFKGYYSDEWGKEHPYAHRFIRSYKEGAQKMFKAFMTALEKSNDVDLSAKIINGKLSAKDFEGKLIGAVIGYEEYQKTDGNKGERTYIASTRSVEAIQTGNYKVPELKPYIESAPAPQNDGFIPLKDEDLPF